MASQHICSVHPCSKPVRARGFCVAHWARWKKHGDPEAITVSPLPPVCDAPACDRRPHTRWKGGAAYCNKHWLRMSAHGALDLPAKQPKTQTVCGIDGCTNDTRSLNGKLCEVHYYRRYRTGVFDPRPKAGFTRRSHGYMSKNDASHPASTPGGTLYQHRAVLYDAIGVGPHPCHWCLKMVTWAPGKKTSFGALVVDHLDDNKANNDLANLKPSCHSCNATRGRLSCEAA